MAQIDPLLLDLVASDRGDLTTSTDTLYEAVHLRLTTARGTCFWDRTFGSTLHTFARSKITKRTAAELEDAVRDALVPLLESKELSALAFEHDRPAPNRWHIRLSALARSRRRFTYDLFVEVA